MIELEQFGTLQPMRALSLVIFSVYLCVGAFPCIGASVEKPALSAHAADHAHAQAHRQDHDSIDPVRHRHCDEVAPVSKFRARCPCGCGEGSASTNSFVRLGLGLSRDVFDLAAIDSQREVGAPVVWFIQAPLRAVDHVPIAA